MSGPRHGQFVRIEETQNRGGTKFRVVWGREATLNVAVEVELLPDWASVERYLHGMTIGVIEWSPGPSARGPSSTDVNETR